MKELRESLRWLRLVQRVPLIKPAAKVKPLLQETDELVRIFVKSIQTAGSAGAARRSKLAVGS